MCGGNEHVEGALRRRRPGEAQAALALGAAAALALAADLSSKSWAVRHAAPDLRPLLPGLVSTVLTRNTGASFGILAGAPWAVSALAIVVTAVVLVLWWVEGRRDVLASVSVGLIVGGALGNLRDRIVFGHVIDFLRFDFAPWWPVFNVADVFTVVGAVLLGAWMAWASRRRGEKSP